VLSSSAATSRKLFDRYLFSTILGFHRLLSFQGYESLDFNFVAVFGHVATLRAEPFNQAEVTKTINLV
jgi:hypothetical protein